LRWRDFREEFEQRYYSWEHRREKEHEFLDLRQGDLIVLEYERRYQDLTAFASAYLPTERHRVEMFRNGLRQELRMILIAMQFQSVRELVRATQGMERVIRDTPKLVVEQSQATGAKRRDFEFLTGRPHLPKKGKSRQSSGQFQRRGGSFTPGGSSRGSRQVSGKGSWGGQPRQGVKTVGGSIEQKGPVYPFCQRCEQRHRRDCSAMPGRCIIYRREGHRWRECPHVGRGCYYYGDMSHGKKDCPRRTTEEAHGQRIKVQSQQQ
jgi:hypothetical protein